MAEVETTVLLARPSRLISGHRRLLGVLADFRSEAAPRGEMDLDAARALVSFLRHELLPFATREERTLATDPAELETTRFEHAFLAAEIDGLAGAVDTAHADDVVRRIHRIEAILEMHAARHEDRWGDGEVAVRPCPATPVAGRAPARNLDVLEIDAVLRRNWWAILSTAAAGRPYAVPVAYGMHDGVFYVASRKGMKVRNIEANPFVCLTIAEVENGARWCSVVATGSAEEVEGPAAVVRALRALARQCGRQHAARPMQGRRLLGARLFRITPDAITGRIREEEG